MTPTVPFTLGYFAPLPPAPSGVADYAAAMLSGFRALGDVSVNESGLVNLYHVGNNRLHAGIYQRALAEPGVVVLHDAMLHHLLLGTLDEHGYEEEFVYNYGEWQRSLAKALWRRRASAMGDPQFFRYPLLRRLAERSRVVIVHGDGARRALLAHCPSGNVAVLPHLALAPVAESHWTTLDAARERERFRREELGVSSGELLLGVYGYLRESKRLPSVLDALDHLRAEGIPVRLLVAGSFASEDYARTWLPRLKAHPGLLLRGSSGERTFARLLDAADVCVNLKYPSAGESSGIAARALALGVPLVVSAGEEPGEGELPGGSYVPVQTGPAEAASLYTALAWLLRDEDARRAVALAGQQWCRDAMNPDVVCRAVWRLARSAA
ncbi:MAG: glycosyltransferase family 4 protein [Bryobacterales bacterium]|nr:glycosyltransferase family 4 protein [Bryobacterales bacterium]